MTTKRSVSKFAAVMTVIVICLTFIAARLSFAEVPLGQSMKIYKTDGTAATSGNVTILISDVNDCNGTVYNSTFQNEIDRGVFSRTIDVNLTYGKTYYECVRYNNVQISGPFKVFGIGLIGPEDLTNDTFTFRNINMTTGAATNWVMTGNAKDVNGDGEKNVFCIGNLSWSADRYSSSNNQAFCLRPGTSEAYLENSILRITNTGGNQIFIGEGDGDISGVETIQADNFGISGNTGSYGLLIPTSGDDTANIPIATVSGLPTYGLFFDLSTYPADAWFKWKLNNVDRWTISALSGIVRQLGVMQADGGYQTNSSELLNYYDRAYNGSNLFKLQDDSGTLRFRNLRQDSDIQFEVNDSGSDTTAILVDGATANVAIGEDLTVGGTGGNIISLNNITTEEIHFEKNATQHRIYDNTSCVIIQGDTATFHIC